MSINECVPPQLQLKRQPGCEDLLQQPSLKRQRGCEGLLQQSSLKGFTGGEPNGDTYGKAERTKLPSPTTAVCSEAKEHVVNALQLSARGTYANDEPTDIRQADLYELLGANDKPIEIPTADLEGLLDANFGPFGIPQNDFDELLEADTSQGNVESWQQYLNKNRKSEPPQGSSPSKPEALAEQPDYPASCRVAYYCVCSKRW